MYIISFDPGKTTGCVVLNATSRNVFSTEFVTQILWETRFDDVKYVIRQYNSAYTKIVIENFLLYKGLAEAQAGSNIPSAQMIGIIAAYTYDYSEVEVDNPLSFCFQMASQIHLSPAAMRLTGKHSRVLYSPKPEEEKYFVGKRHALDAYAHAIFYIQNNSKVLFSEY